MFYKKGALFCHVSMFWAMAELFCKERLFSMDTAFTQIILPEIRAEGIQNWYFLQDTQLFDRASQYTGQL